MMTGNTTLLNPHTPMAFLFPSLAKKVTNLTYGAVGSLAVILWDIILHLPQDYRLATQFRINFSFVIYCIARVSTLAYIFGVVVMITLPVGHCDLLRQISILSPFTIPLSVLPFVMRVSALYSNNKYVVTFFSSSDMALCTSGGAIPSTMYCLNTRTKLANALTSSSVFFLDLFIFMATSWALMRNSYSDFTMKNSIRVMVFGKYLPAFSKSILRDGQAYFLATLVLNFLFVVLCYIPNAPIAPCAIGFPFFVMLNNMSSHVYRNLRFGFYRDYSITSSMVDQALQHHHKVMFENPTSTNLEGKGNLEAGDTTKTKGSLSRGSEEGKMEV